MNWKVLYGNSDILNNIRDQKGAADTRLCVLALAGAQAGAEGVH